LLFKFIFVSATVLIESDLYASLAVKVGSDTTTLAELVSNADGSSWLHSVNSIMAETNGEKNRFNLLQAAALALADQSHSPTSTSKADQAVVNEVVNLCAAKHSATNNVLDVKYTDGTTALERAFRTGQHAIALLFYQAVEQASKSRPIKSELIAKSFHSCSDGEDLKVAVKVLGALALRLVRAEVSDARQQRIADQNDGNHLPVPLADRTSVIGRFFDVIYLGGGSKEERRKPVWLLPGLSDWVRVFQDEIELPLLEEALKVSRSFIV
jgi:hypothetical protein